MADIDVNTDINMGDLVKKMKMFPDRVQKNIVVGAVRAGAKAISDEAKQRVPVDSGALKKSIGVTKRRSKDKSIVWFSVSPRKGGKNDGWYGHLVEFGTAHSVAHPFVRPAYEKEGDHTIEAVRAYMRKRIDKEIARL